MLEFYYDFLDKYLDRINFDLIQMDTNSMHIAISHESDEIVSPELRFQYDNKGKAEFLSTSKYHDQMLGSFKDEFQGKKMITLMSKCYYGEDGKLKNKTKF